MRTRQIQYLRPDEIRAELEKTPAAYLPLGLLEWHGPHLPYGVDALNAEAVALAAAEIAGGLVLPTVYFGTERERDPRTLENLGFDREAYIVGMDFPANSLPSMYAAEELFALMVREHVRLAIAMGFKVVSVISGHGAVNQLAVLRRLAAEFNAPGRFKMLVDVPFTVGAKGMVEVGHASRIETAVMLHLAPETVKLDALPPLPEPLRSVDYAIVDYLTFAGQPTPDHTVHDEDDPRRASAADGQRTIERAAAHIARRVQAALE